MKDFYTIVYSEEKVDNFVGDVYEDGEDVYLLIGDTFAKLKCDAEDGWTSGGPRLTLSEIDAPIKYVGKMKKLTIDDLRINCIRFRDLRMEYQAAMRYIGMEGLEQKIQGGAWIPFKSEGDWGDQILRAKFPWYPVKLEGGAWVVERYELRELIQADMVHSIVYKQGSTYCRWTNDVWYHVYNEPDYPAISRVAKGIDIVPMIPVAVRVK